MTYADTWRHGGSCLKSFFLLLSVALTGGTQFLICFNKINEISENQMDLNRSLLPVGLDLTMVGVHIF